MQLLSIPDSSWKGRAWAWASSRPAFHKEVSEVVKIKNTMPCPGHHGEQALAYLCNAFNNIGSHNDWVLLVEDTGRQNPEDARKHSLQLCSLLLMLLDLQKSALMNT